ncbi:hypothetical protein OTK49_01995 [Vibrio coralliirubri]|uniref:hypothetical protein n=1 Tax=Vibrio coralliirubri TaxID=1516159 RepID=UPI002283BB3C|nr:hypothetical protein [Vibrio coralliirubri]MCY9861286.1 hypothetical protein [Vibrio coralliirubri]
MVNPTEINISFTSINDDVYHTEERIIVVALCGGKLFKSNMTEEQVSELRENLADAFSFLAVDGVVDVECQID